MSRSACEVCGETYDCCGQCGTCHKCMGEDINRLKAELESKDKAVKLLQGHCNALMDTEGKLAQWNKGHIAGMESAGYYQKQSDDMIRQLRKELSDENANFTEEIMNLELQLAEARAEIERLSSPDYYACAMCPDIKQARQDVAREILEWAVAGAEDFEEWVAMVKERFGLEG